MQLDGRLCKSYQIYKICCTLIVEFNHLVSLTYLEGSLRSKQFKRDCCLTSHIRHEIYFGPFSRFNIASEVRFSSSGSHILNFALDTFPCFDFLTDYHIDERGKIKIDEIPQALAKGRSVTIEIFCIFVTLYTKTGLTTQSEKFS